MRDIYECKYRKRHPYWSNHDNKDTISVQNEQREVTIKLPQNKFVYDDWCSTNHYIVSKFKCRQSLKKDETRKRKPSSD